MHHYKAYSYGEITGVSLCYDTFISMITVSVLLLPPPNGFQMASKWLLNGFKLSFSLSVIQH